MARVRPQATAATIEKPAQRGFEILVDGKPRSYRDIK
jgi:hypothetical protein